MITIIDYGVGNLFSLISSLKMIGADAVATSDPEAIKEADKLILPGVGAFADAIEKLKARQALPTPMRTIIPVSAEPDFSTMSSEEFARFKRRRFGQ